MVLLASAGDIPGAVCTPAPPIRVPVFFKARSYVPALCILLVGGGVPDPADLPLPDYT